MSDQIQKGSDNLKIWSDIAIYNVCKFCANYLQNDKIVKYIMKLALP